MLNIQSEENMTNPDFDDYDADEGTGVKKAIGLGPPKASPNTSIAVLAPDQTTTAEVIETTTNATTAAAAAAGGGLLDGWIIALIVIVSLIIAFILFVIFCCWWDKRKLKAKIDKGVNNTSLATARSNNQTTPLICVSSMKVSENSSGSSKRPLRLTKSNHADNSPDCAGAALVEKNLPDPYSPVKYINTPVPMPSEIEMTHTEHVAPPTMDEALNKHVVTPMEKAPELHIDDYNI